MERLIVTSFWVKRGVIPVSCVCIITGYGVQRFTRNFNCEPVGAAAFLSLLIFASLLIQFSAQAVGSEITAFKLMSYEGSLKLGYSRTARDVEYAEGGGISERHPLYDQELSLNTLSYVFHPNLLEMELGAGVKFTQEKLETEFATNEMRSKLYNFNSTFNFLKNKPYPLRLHYNQSNPEMGLGIADSMTMEEKNYGMNFSLMEPLVSTPMNLYAEHRETTGEDSDTVVADTTDTAQFRITTFFGDYGSGQFGINSSVTKSESGSLNLPIQESESDTKSASWDSKLSFGPEDNINLVNTITLTRDKQSNVSDRDDGRLYANLDWRHNDYFRTFYTYNLSSIKYDFDKTINNDLAIGALSVLSDSVNFTTAINGTRSSNTGFEKHAYGINNNISYKDDITDSVRMSAGYSLLYRVNSQDTDVSRITVRDEALVLSGLGSVTLANDYVVSGTVIVSNSTHTQIYVENFDYILTQVGSETRLSRTVSGNISDGETVLVEYAYESGGSYDFDEIYQSMNLGYSLNNTYRFHMNYLLRRKILIEGNPDNFLESSKRIRLSADAQIPLSQTMSYGWKLDLEKQLDEDQPFVRDAVGANIRTSLPWFSGFLSLDSLYNHVDNQESENDTKLARLSALASGRFTQRSSGSMELTHERDTGGDMPNTRKYAKFNYLWQRNLLGFALEAKYGLEEQGDFTRSDTAIKAELVRTIR